MHSSLHTNNQSIRWSILKRGKYLLLEITWDDYVLHYILKYIPTYVRMDWPSTTTRQMHTKGLKYFYQNFCGHQQYPYLQYPCFWWYWVHYKKSFIFRVIHILMTCWLYDTTETTEKYLSGRIFLPKIFLHLILVSVDSKIFPNFMEIGGLLFFGPFGMAAPTYVFAVPPGTVKQEDP